MKYIDADLLRKEIKRRIEILKKVELDLSQQGDTETSVYYLGKSVALDEFANFIDSLQQELDSRSIPVLRADTTEKQDRILEIIGQDEIYCHFSLDSGKETDCGYEDYNDRVYIDGDLTFNKMAEIVDFLSKNSK